MFLLPVYVISNLNSRSATYLSSKDNNLSNESPSK